MDRGTGRSDFVERERGEPLGFIMRGLRQLHEPSWRTWRVVLRAAFGYGVDDPEELELFKSISGGRNPPARRVKELWLVVGARGGKDSITSMVAAQAACYADEGVALRPGERILVACFANDRRQAQIVYNFTKAYFERHPALSSRLITPLTRTPQPIQLDNDTDIVIATTNFRAPRGWPFALAIFDEVAFWRDEESAIPDSEVYTAVLRGMGMVPNRMIIGISTPYRQKGLLFDKWKKHFGEEDDDVLVIQGPTRTFNPLFQQSVIDAALEDDYEKNSAEYLAQWRRDLADYVQREVVEAATPRGVTVIPFRHGVEYKAFCDPSGGSRDSMTLAIAHAEEDRGYLDYIDEVRAPFQPSVVVEKFAAQLRQYQLSEVTGDRYAGEWPTESFQTHGITYVASELTKVDIYRDFLPFLNSGRVELLDNKRLGTQLCRLERRTARGGRDSIDHPPNEHDDVANAAAGALLSVVIALSDLEVWKRMAG